MDLTSALILALVEGLTEFLPISSTGHLILTSYLLKIPQTEFLKSFEVIIQLGAILAVVTLYFNRILSNKAWWPKILAAFLPTAFLGLILYQFIKQFLLSNTMITLIALFLGGILLIMLEKIYQGRTSKITNIDQLSYTQALAIGLFQSISMIPGVSRAGATIFGGLFLGMDRKTAVEFSFILAIPTMVAATSLNLMKSSFAWTTDQYLLLCAGLAGSFITALVAIKFLITFIQTHTFIPFGIYRIVLAILFWIFILR